MCLTYSILTYGCRDGVQQGEAAKSGELRSQNIWVGQPLAPLKVNLTQLVNFSVLQVPNLQMGIFLCPFSETPKAMETRSCSFVIIVFLKK